MGCMHLYFGHALPLFLSRRKNVMTRVCLQMVFVHRNASIMYSSYRRWAAYINQRVDLVSVLTIRMISPEVSSIGGGSTNPLSICI